MPVLIYAGIAADRNNRAMSGAAELGNTISQAYGWVTETVSEHQPLLSGSWLQQLQFARPFLNQLASEVGLPWIAVDLLCCLLADVPQALRHYRNLRPATPMLR
jgi:hypothetical protein